jgi:hypothetical protein
MAWAAIAGSIRAGCWVEAGRYRPRRWEGAACCAVAHTEAGASGSIGRVYVGLGTGVL